jgi:hypothetical protein
LLVVDKMSSKFKCDIEGCNASFTRIFNLNRHKARKHSGSDISENCLLCGKAFQDVTKLQEHLIGDHGPSDKFYAKESAFNQSVQVFRYNYDTEQLNFNNAQSAIKDEINETLRFEVAKSHHIKASLIFICKMSMLDFSGQKIQSVLIPFRSNGFVISSSKTRNMINSLIKKAFREQENALEEYCNSGSNWIFDRAVAFDIEIATLKPIVVGNQSEDGETDDDDDDVCEPSTLNLEDFKNKQFLFNPQNNDNKCFLRCLFYLLKFRNSPKKELRSFKKWEKTLNLKGIKFPITISHVRKFVKQNQCLNVKLNILFRSLDDKIYPYECNLGEGQLVLNLLMVHVTPKKFPPKRIMKAVNHFVAIKDVNKYLRKQYNRQSGGTCYKNSFYCLNCFNCFSVETALKSHQEICLINKPIKEIASPGKITFKNPHYQHKQDYIGFLDFECMLSPNANPCDDCRSLRCKCDKSFSEIVTHQEPIAFSFVIVDSNNSIVHEHTFAGENAADVFIEHLTECEEEWLCRLLHTKHPMIITPDEQDAFELSTHCYMCFRSFENTKSVKCRDHNHFTGLYIGPACQKCNLLRTREKRLPIFLHNGSKYDFHFIIRALNKKNRIHKLNVLPYNSEHFRTIEFNCFKLLDSLAFLQASLAQLSDDLAKTNHPYTILKQTNLVKTSGLFNEQKFKAVLHKSFFPYEFCTSLELMQNTTKLPKRKDFYSQLQDKSISKDDHKFARKVWKMFKCQNLVDYTKIYCKIDTILLAEIFQQFRTDMMNFSGLDPSHYMSLPAYAFDSMLKFTKCSLDRLPHINMVHFIESSIRGGVSFINTRQLKVVSPEEIIYIDANVSNMLIIMVFLL